MDALLGKITQHAMNYAIRSGVGITASFAISQTSRLLKTVENKADRREIQALQERLQIKTQIISPAIDLIVLISARGNTTLQSAVNLTKALQWDIQSLGIRIEKAASAEESSLHAKTGAKSAAAHEAEIRRITQDIKNLLVRIEDAVPLLNLAISTSGASLSSQLPPSVSPSRLLQASNYLSGGDILYSTTQDAEVQVGPTFTLSLYMLFAGHFNRPKVHIDNMKEATWKEVIHKARVKLVRFPRESPKNAGQRHGSSVPLAESVERSQEPINPGVSRAHHYSYRFDIIEDLDDDRVHSFEDGEQQPGPYQDVPLAGIREVLPIYQISKIFYADTGKILNIGNAGEASSPILLLKRDINAPPPASMMTENEKANDWSEEPDFIPTPDAESDDDSQDDIDKQLRRESSVNHNKEADILSDVDSWKLPADLDPEWLAFEIYAESEDSDTEDGDDVKDPSDDSAYVSHRPSLSTQSENEESLISGIADLDLDSRAPPQMETSMQLLHCPRPSVPQDFTPFGPVRFTSLSTMEMLIRLTSLQQFKQQSHLTISDNLLSFFLQDSSTTGGGDAKQRRRTRLDAINKVGFDPYNESPLKFRPENHQNQQNQDQGEEEYGGQPRMGTPNTGYSPRYSRSGTPYDGYDQRYSRGNTPYDDYDRPLSREVTPFEDSELLGGYDILNPHWSEQRGTTPQGTPGPWLLRDKEHNLTNTHSSSGSSRRAPPSSPVSPYKPMPRQGGVRPIDRVMQDRGAMRGSPLGRGTKAETDSSYGASPGSPTLVDQSDKTGTMDK